MLLGVVGAAAVAWVVVVVFWVRAMLDYFRRGASPR